LAVLVDHLGCPRCHRLALAFLFVAWNRPASSGPLIAIGS
jgi:hypothetical protein